MKMTTKNVLGGAVASLAILISVAHAQPVNPAVGPQPDQPTGLLGKSYGTVNAEVGKYRHFSAAPTIWGPEVSVNQPLTDHFDFNAAYDYMRGNSAAYRIRDNSVDAGLTGYYRLNGIVPFVSADVGYEWDRLRSFGVDTKPNHGFYDLTAGAEIPVITGLSIRPTIGYGESLKKPHGHSWNWGANANYWFTRQVAGDVGITFVDGKSGASDAVVYTAGLRFNF